MTIQVHHANSSQGGIISQIAKNEREIQDLKKATQVLYFFVKALRES